MDKFLLFLIGIFFSFCNQSVVFEDYHNFQKNEWETDSLVKFEYFIEDTICSYNFFLKIRHNINYEFQNLFLFLESEQEKDTVELVIANKNGKWIGKGLGDIREVKIKTNKKYLNSGSKTLFIEQAMRYGSEEKIKKLKNINAVGLTILKSNE